MATNFVTSKYKKLKMIKSKTTHRCNSDLHIVVGFNWFYRIVSQNFTGSANRPALLFILVPVVEIEPAENITLVMEPPEKKFQSHHCLQTRFIQKVSVFFV